MRQACGKLALGTAEQLSTVSRGLAAYKTSDSMMLRGHRIIGDKRSASIAFVVEESEVIVLGVFYGRRCDRA